MPAEAFWNRQHVWGRGDRPVAPTTVVWQEREDSNPRHPVLETGALPTELRSYMVPLEGLEPPTRDLGRRRSIQAELQGHGPGQRCPYRTVCIVSFILAGRRWGFQCTLTVNRSLPSVIPAEAGIQESIVQPRPFDKLRANGPGLSLRSPGMASSDRPPPSGFRRIRTPVTLTEVPLKKGKNR